MDTHITKVTIEIKKTTRRLSPINGRYFLQSIVPMKYPVKLPKPNSVNKM